MQFMWRVESNYCGIEKEKNPENRQHLELLSLRFFSAEDIKILAGSRDKWRADIERVNRY